MLATKKQLFALYLGTGKCLELREMNLSKDDASILISRMKNGETVSNDLLSMGATKKLSSVSKKVDKKLVDFQAIYDTARKAGLEAVNKLNVRPMVVQQHSNVLDDNSPVTDSYFVADGVCGFASINFAGNTGWGRWCKKNKLADKSYDRGYYIWVSEFNQSLQKKEAYASAFCKVLNENNISAYSTSHMD